MATAVNLEARNSISVLEQGVFLKFCFLENLTAAETHRRLQHVMGTNALSDSQVRLWFSRFREGNWTTQETRGRPCSSEAATQERIEEIREAFDESRAWSLRALSEKLHVPR